MSLDNRTALVIGYGSIGKRHTKILSSLGINVVIKSKQFNLPFPTVKTTAEALHKYSVTYVIISNITSEHFQELCELIYLGYTGTILIEKPIFVWPEKIPKNNIRNIYVAYNLRFHPLIKFFRDYIANHDPLCVDIYVGQYLPLWRPSRDYRLSYCGDKTKGGGVLRDMSHELDYLLWIFGLPSDLTAVGGHYSALNINSEDIYTILFKFSKCPIVSLRINYLDKMPSRAIRIISDKETVEIDLYQGSVDINGSRTVYQYDRDLSYKEQHIAALANNGNFLCDDLQAQVVLSIICNIEEAAVQQKWIKI